MNLVSVPVPVLVPVLKSVSFRFQFQFLAKFNRLFSVPVPVPVLHHWPKASEVNARVNIAQFSVAEPEPKRTD